MVPNICAPATVALETFGDGAAPDTGGWNDGTGGAVADAGEDGVGDHALMYVATPPQAGFHVLHPALGGTPNPDFLGNYRFNQATDVIFRARHSGVGDSVVLRVVLFGTLIDINWAQTAAAVTIANTATQWQTYSLSIRRADLVTGGVDGLTLSEILISIEQIGLRHDPLGTGPWTYSPVSQQTTVFFDDIELSAQGGVGPL